LGPKTARPLAFVLNDVLSEPMPMRSYPVEIATLGLAVLVYGIMAGFFWTYSVNVGPALQQVDGPTYAVVQSLLNEHVRHSTFFVFFFGGGGGAAIALLVLGRRWRTLSFWLVVLAGTLYVVGVIVFTAEVHLPLNADTESWNPRSLPPDWTVVRREWIEANWIRVGASSLSFVLSLVALILVCHREP
jgi:uncharacterized membrane protein